MNNTSWGVFVLYSCFLHGDRQKLPIFKLQYRKNLSTISMKRSRGVLMIHIAIHRSIIKKWQKWPLSLHTRLSSCHDDSACELTQDRLWACPEYIFKNTQNKRYIIFVVKYSNSCTIMSKRNGTLFFSARQNFGWQLWICSRGERGWKAVIGQTRNAQVMQAQRSPLYENIQSCQLKSRFSKKGWRFFCSW